MQMAVLVRHGQSTVNVQKIVSSDYEGYPLTRKGRTQAFALALELKGLRFDGIITSPLERARETAEILGNELGHKVLQDERARESGLGRYNNFRLSTIPTKSHSELGMESWESHIERFSSLAGSFQGCYIIVSHAYPIRAYASSFLGLGELESGGVGIKNATATVVDIDQGKVLSLGSYVLSRKVRNRIGACPE